MRPRQALVVFFFLLANSWLSRADSDASLDDDPEMDSRGDEGEGASEDSDNYKYDDYSYEDVEVGHRLLGGEDSNEGEFPYQVSIRVGVEHMCGGSVLTNTMILTAAHCCEDVEPSKMTVAAGSSQLFKPIASKQERKVTKMIWHAQYKPRYHDICLLKLDTPLMFNRYVLPVTLPEVQGEDPPKNSMLIISGWGRMEEKPTVKHPETLQWAIVPFVDEGTCLNIYQKFMPFFHKGSVCAGHLETMHVDTCSGDSGGPLTLYKNGKHIQVGIVAWGPAACASPGYPGVYTKVSYYLDWIQHQIKIN